jgi:hypothetical protein
VDGGMSETHRNGVVHNVHYVFDRTSTIADRLHDLTFAVQSVIDVARNRRSSVIHSVAMSRLDSPDAEIRNEVETLEVGSRILHDHRRAPHNVITSEKSLTVTETQMIRRVSGCVYSEDLI